VAERNSLNIYFSLPVPHVRETGALADVPGSRPQFRADPFSCRTGDSASHCFIAFPIFRAFFFPDLRCCFFFFFVPIAPSLTIVFISTFLARRCLVFRFAERTFSQRPPFARSCPAPGDDRGLPKPSTSIVLMVSIVSSAGSSAFTGSYDRICLPDAPCSGSFLVSFSAFACPTHARGGKSRWCR